MVAKKILFIMLLSVAFLSDVLRRFLSMVWTGNNISEGHLSVIPFYELPIDEKAEKWAQKILNFFQYPVF